jgi:hypothetical protein
MRPLIITSAFYCFILGVSSPCLSLAEDKSYYSPVIHVDKENSRILISTLGSVFWVEVPDEAKPHLDKLPISGLADFVVEMRPGKPPLVKTWKFPTSETTCKHFDGKTCR